MDTEKMLEERQKALEELLRKYKKNDNHWLYYMAYIILLCFFIVVLNFLDYSRDTVLIAGMLLGQAFTSSK